jgi:hypothetical protein
VVEVVIRCSPSEVLAWRQGFDLLVHCHLVDLLDIVFLGDRPSVRGPAYSFYKLRKGSASGVFLGEEPPSEGRTRRSYHRVKPSLL